MKSTTKIARVFVVSLAVILMLTMVFSGCAAPTTVTTTVTTTATATTTAAQAPAELYAKGMLPCMQGSPDLTGPWKMCGVMPMTGPIPQYGMYFRRGSDMAIEDLEKAGWTGDKSVIVTSEDQQNDPKLAISGMLRVIAMEDVLMLESVGSSVVLAMEPLLVKHEIPGINTAATSPKIREASKGWLFSTVPSTFVEARLVADFAYDDLGAKTAAILYVNNEFGLGGLEVFTEAFEGMGGEIVASESHEQGATDFRTQWTKVKGANPDVLYFCSHDVEAGYALKQKKEMAVDVQVVGCSPISTGAMLEVAGEGAEGYIGALQQYDIVSGTAKMLAFDKRYVEKYGESSNQYVAGAYDTVTMFADAIKSGATTRSAIRDYLATHIKNYPGQLGIYGFDEDGQYDGPMGWTTVKDGEFSKLK